jgi:MFS family permease
MFSMSLVSGLLIPLLALILERQGESAIFNGISTMTVYVSFIIASPFVAPLNSWMGPRKTVAAFLMAASVAVFAFPFIRHTYAWIAFRLVFGTCLSAVSVTTEIWLNKVLTDSNRGIGFAGYGFSFTSGLAIGPLCIGLIDVSEYIPFIAGSLILVAGVAITLFLSQDQPLAPADQEDSERPTAFRRSWGIVTLAPHCMASAFVFGFMDGILNGDLPIWGTRVLLSTGQISACLTIFVLGTIFFQIPLGYLSDFWGRRQTLLVITAVGFIAMSSVLFTVQYFYGLMAAFFIMGASLGPTYSLGLAFLGDTVKSDDITLANVLYMMTYGLGSLFGPFSVSLLISVTDRPGPFVWVSLVVLAGYMLVGVLDSNPVRAALRNCCN